MEPRDSDPPTIETVEGIGAAYLVWSRDTIIDLLQRVAFLERRLEDSSE